jgi:hypothetical protein
MKNKISDLRDHMFAALERLGQEELTKEDLEKEIARSQAISEVGKVIVESAKTEIMYAKLSGKKDGSSERFLEVEPKKLAGGGGSDSTSNKSYYHQS